MSIEKVIVEFVKLGSTFMLLWRLIREITDRWKSYSHKGQSVTPRPHWAKDMPPGTNTEADFRFWYKYSRRFKVSAQIQ